MLYVEIEEYGIKSFERVNTITLDYYTLRINEHEVLHADDLRVVKNLYKEYAKQMLDNETHFYHFDLDAD